MTSLHYCPELEAQILGHLMYIATSGDPRVQKAMLRLTTKSFYKAINASIFVLISQSFRKQEPFGFVDILVQVGQHNDELHQQVSGIMDSYLSINVSEAKIDYDISRLLGLQKARNSVRIAEEAIANASVLSDPTEVNQVLADMGKKLCEMECVDFSRGFTQQEIMDDILSGKHDKARIVPTRSMQFNSRLGGGVRNKCLITIGGAAGVGKTGFALWLLDIIARNQPDRQSIFYSLEMDPPDILMRHLGICAGKQYDRLIEAEITDAAASAFSVPIRIFDYRANDIETILTTSRLMATEKPISVIVVDYLTLVTNGGIFQRYDLCQADITTRLARLAQELGCVVIALSQVNRAAATREDQCPFPHDAADSSGSHRSSALWIGIDRPELYTEEPWAKDLFVIKCRKNRYGSNFEYVLSFNEGTFVEISPGHFQKPEKKSKPEKIFESPYKPHHG